MVAFVLRLLVKYLIGPIVGLLISRALLEVCHRSGLYPEKWIADLIMDAATPENIKVIGWVLSAVIGTSLYAVSYYFLFYRRRLKRESGTAKKLPPFHLYIDPPEKIKIEWREPKDSIDVDAIINPEFIADDQKNRTLLFYITNHNTFALKNINIKWIYNGQPLSVVVANCPFLQNFETYVDNNRLAVAARKEGKHHAQMTEFSSSGTSRIRTLGIAPEGTEKNQHSIFLPETVSRMLGLTALCASSRKFEASVMGDDEQMELIKRLGEGFDIEEFATRLSPGFQPYMDLYEISVQITAQTPNGIEMKKDFTFEVKYLSALSPVYAHDTEGNPHVSLPQGWIEIKERGE